ncbi:MAG TPA: pyrroline-5-carboxylate reductase [Dehalococcoidia bacterium]
MRIGFVGGGNMAEAMIGGLLGRNLAGPADVVVAEISGPRRDHLTRQYAVHAVPDPAAAAAGMEAVVLAVHPQDFPEAARGLRGHLEPGQTVISIMAGVKIDAIREALGHDAVVRVMPNTPARIGEGISVWTATPEVPEERRAEVAALLESLGRQVQVAEERLVDMATAVSGSGPAYVFLFIESLIDAGVYLGLRRDLAAELAVQTVLGAARFAQSSGNHPAELRNLVTSPGGTTAEALLVLEQSGFRAAVIEAVAAAYEKARVLGG